LRSYIPALAAVFRIPQTVGFIGGSPSSSYYFVASQSGGSSASRDERVIYLDPHVVQQTVNVCEPDASTESYHCRNVRSMKLSMIDPSLTLGFLVKSQAEFDDLCSSLPSTLRGEFCAVCESEPSDSDWSLQDDQVEDDMVLLG